MRGAIIIENQNDLKEFLQDQTLEAITARLDGVKIPLSTVSQIWKVPVSTIRNLLKFKPEIPHERGVRGSATVMPLPFVLKNDFKTTRDQFKTQ